VSSAWISGFAIRVADVERSTTFYTQSFGLRKGDSFGGGNMQQLVGTEDEATSLLLVNRSPGTAAPEVGTGVEKLLITCDDLASAYALALVQGGASVAEPRRIDAMQLTVAMVRDLDGYVIELIQRD
jgi:lactoylglutathione lyase